MLARVCRVALLLVATSAFDLTWLPADAEADGPLPLSKNYRQKLGEACSMLRKKDAPQSIVRKRHILASMCRRLEADASVGGSYDEGSSGGYEVGSGGAVDPRLMATVMLLGGAFFLFGRRQNGAQSHSTAVPATEAETREAREARLRRFAS